MTIKKGDFILLESPTYVGSLAFLRPLGAQFVEIDVDQYGMNPEKMDEILSKWDDIQTRPKILYTIPNGGRINLIYMYSY